MPVARPTYHYTPQEWLDRFEYHSVEEMQAEYNLPPTGIIDDRTVKAMAAPRCGCAFRRDRRPAAEQKLPTKRPLVFFQDWIRDSGFNKESFAARVLEGMNLWSFVCDLIFAETSDKSKANIVVETEAIDGPSNTLAYAYFPAGARLQLPLRFDTGEGWDQDWGPSLATTSCHEGGHNAGVDHDPTAKGVMAAFYNKNVLVPTSSWEINEMVARYGQPTKPSVPTTPATPGLDEMIQIFVSGKDLKVVGYERVKK